MKDEERAQLVTDLINYVAMMAPHQKERMGGKLIIRACQALKSMRIVEPTESEHRARLLEKEV